MEPNKLTNNFLKRFKEFGEYLKNADVDLEYCETFNPIKEEEIKSLENEMGVKLDETLLAYFRESNGYYLEYSFGSGDVKGAIMIPSLGDILVEQMEVVSRPGDYQIENLGGRDDFEMRSNMFWFDHFGASDDGVIGGAVAGAIMGSTGIVSRVGSWLHRVIVS